MKLSELGPEALADLLADGTVSVKAATGFTGDTRTALYAAMRAGDLAYFNRGRRRLIPRKSLVQYLANQAVANAK